MYLYCTPIEFAVQPDCRPPARYFPEGITVNPGGLQYNLWVGYAPCGVDNAQGFGNRARFITVLHSEHYFEEGRDSNRFYRYLNWEYLYWFKYSQMIDTMVVSTQEQKEKLAEDLKKYQCFVPEIEVIPAGGIEGLKYPEKARKPYLESKVYYSRGNREVIVSQPQNDMIALLENGAVKFFFNSYHRFVEFYLGKIEGEIILFVQGAEQRELLGLERNGKSAWKSVLFAGRELWENYVKAGGKNGYRFYAIPERYPENHAGGNAMILTASDQIEKLEELAQELPEVIFHVAAHTQVSDKLYKLAERENVKVYPCISGAGLKDLWDKCDFYLDINHRREIDDAVNEASQRNLLILGFENTLHHREIVVEECVFLVEDYGKMVLGIKSLLKDTVQAVPYLNHSEEPNKFSLQSIPNHGLCFQAKNSILTVF